MQFYFDINSLCLSRIKPNSKKQKGRLFVPYSRSISLYIYISNNQLIIQLVNRAVATEKLSMSPVNLTISNTIKICYPSPCFLIFKFTFYESDETGQTLVMITTSLHLILFVGARKEVQALESVLLK